MMVFNKTVLTHLQEKNSAECFIHLFGCNQVVILFVYSSQVEMASFNVKNITVIRSI